MKNIVFFDGVCGLCNWTVDFLMRRNGQGRLLFATLQGNTAKQELNREYLADLDTVIFKKGEHIYEKSTAALEILRELGGVYKLAIIFYLVPRFLRDFIYNRVANNRYAVWGKRETCRLPTPEERKYFLD